MDSLERGYELARQLLLNEEERAEAQRDANGEDLVRVERGFARLDADLSRWFGGEGYRFMVARAVAKARDRLPILRNGPTHSHASVTLRDVVSSLRAAPHTEVRDAQLQLLGIFIAQLDRLVGPELATRLVTRAWWPGADGRSLPTDQRTRE